MKVYDVEIESQDSLKEAILQREYIKVGNTVYVSQYLMPPIASGVGVCPRCQFYRIKSMLKSAIAIKLCAACGQADIDINFRKDQLGLLERMHQKLKLHYLQKIT